MDVPQSSQTAPRSRPLDPFAQMAARRQQSTSNEKPKQRGPQKGSKYRQRGLQLAEMPMVLSVRLLMLLAPAFLLIAFAQGKRTRRKAERFEDKQAATRLQEDQHNLQKYNKKYVNLKDAAELTTSKSAAEDCTTVRGTPAVCLSSNLSTTRQAKEARKRRHAPLAASRAADKYALIGKWVARADKAILELSWRQKSVRGVGCEVRTAERRA